MSTLKFTQNSISNESIKKENSDAMLKRLDLNQLTVESNSQSIVKINAGNIEQLGPLRLAGA